MDLGAVEFGLDQEFVSNCSLSELDVKRISATARAESRNREKFYPPISTFRWWARRTVAVVEGVLEAYVKSRGQQKILVCDPFAGGGAVGLAAVIGGHKAYLQDINAWATSGLRLTPPVFAVAQAAKSSTSTRTEIIEPDPEDLDILFLAKRDMMTPPGDSFIYRIR